MRRKLKNLKNKSGHSDNGSPRQLIDEAAYRERRQIAATGRHYDSAYAGLSWATRPRDSAISLRGRSGPTGPTGPSGPSSPS